MESADGVCCREYSGEFCEDELKFRMHRDPLLFWIMQIRHLLV